MKCGRAPQATSSKLRLRRPGGASQFRAEKPPLAAAPPWRAQAWAPTLPGGHFLPRLLATAGSVVDSPGRGSAGRSPEFRRQCDGKSGVSACHMALKGRRPEWAFAARLPRSIQGRTGAAAKAGCPEASWKGRG